MVTVKRCISSILSLSLFCTNLSGISASINNQHSTKTIHLSESLLAPPGAGPALTRELNTTPLASQPANNTLALLGVSFKDNTAELNNLEGSLSPEHISKLVNSMDLLLKELATSGMINDGIKSIRVVRGSDRLVRVYLNIGLIELDEKIFRNDDLLNMALDYALRRVVMAAIPNRQDRVIEEVLAMRGVFDRFLGLSDKNKKAVQKTLAGIDSGGPLRVLNKAGVDKKNVVKEIVEYVRSNAYPQLQQATGSLIYDAAFLEKQLKTIKNENARVSPLMAKDYAKYQMKNEPDTVEFGVTLVIGYPFSNELTSKIKAVQENIGESIRSTGIDDVVLLPYDSYHMHTTVLPAIRGTYDPIHNLEYGEGKIDTAALADVMSKSKPFWIMFNKIIINNRGEIVIGGRAVSDDDKKNLTDIRKKLIKEAKFVGRLSDMGSSVHTMIGRIRNFHLLSYLQRKQLAGSIGKILKEGDSLGSMNVKNFTFIQYAHRSIAKVVGGVKFQLGEVYADYTAILGHLNLGTNMEEYRKLETRQNSQVGIEGNAASMSINRIVHNTVGEAL